MQDHVLVLPDGTDGFLRTRKLASLFAEKIHVFSPASNDSLDQLKGLLDHVFLSPKAVYNNLDAIIADTPKWRRRCAKDPAFKDWIADVLIRDYNDHPASIYVRQCAANEKELDALKSAGILTSKFDDVIPHLPSGGDAMPAFMEKFKDALTALGKGSFKFNEIPDMYRRENARRHPTMCSGLNVLFQFVMMQKNGSASKDKETRFTKEQIGKAANAFYFLLSGYNAAQYGCVGVTWHEPTRPFFDCCFNALTAGSPGQERRASRREEIKSRLGELVLLGHVPDDSKLPMDEILEFRLKRQDELASFRISLRSAASKIDPNLAANELEAELENVLHCEVAPRLDEVKRAIEVNRINAWDQALSPSTEIAGGLVDYFLSTTFGTPVEIVPLGAAGAAVANLVHAVSGTYFKNRATIASSCWSALFDLEKTVTKWQKKKQAADKKLKRARRRRR